MVCIWKVGKTGVEFEPGKDFLGQQAQGIWVKSIEKAQYSFECEKKEGRGRQGAEVRQPVTISKEKE